MDSEEMLSLFKALISNSLGFGDDDPWEVTEVWLEDPGDGQYDVVRPGGPSA